MAEYSLYIKCNFSQKLTSKRGKHKVKKSQHGLSCAGDGELINADVNDGENIMKKHPLVLWQTE